MSDEWLETEIAQATSLDWLLRVIALQQSTYWYDPCGKSGNAFEPYLTRISQLAVRRAQVLLGIEVD